MNDSKYEVGDIVTIKDLSIEDGDLYRFGINDDMIDMSGQSFKIKSLSFRSYPLDEGKLPDDGYCYKLEGDSGDWSWASSMFEDQSEDSIAHSVIETKNSSIDAFINKKKCPVLDFTLY